jgi:transcription elongation GreA/GreB family factor
MSRAFVKEDENDKTELPDRPISPHRNFVTEAGLAAIEAALGRFEAAHRAATDKGEKEAAAAALREVRHWRARRASAEVVKPPADKSTASFGTTISLRRVDGREQSFRIVGEDEADPSRGTVSYNVAARAGRSDARSRRDGGNDRWRSHYTRRAVGERGGSGGIIV